MAKEQETLTLQITEMGTDGRAIIRNQLDNFVRDNFMLLYEGAVRLSKNITADYYAPRRVQINSTRLHENVGLKYADGHKIDSDFNITEDELRNTIADLRVLLDAASKNIAPPFKLVVIKN